MKTYSRHNCNRRHRTNQTFIECAIPRVAWVEGDGDYALITWCNVPAVSLWPTAEAAQAKLDGLGSCGHSCRRNHEVVRLDRARATP